MIPKIIHYCWFGRGQMPEQAHMCIESWKKFLPDYEMKLWNEDSFDVTSVPYVKEAYESRKFAFVTDYVRLYAIYEEGGVYMDTDVEVVKSLDDLLNLPAFSGFEGENEIPTGLMAGEKRSEWAKEMLSYYDENRHFIKPDGSFDMTTNVTIIGDMMSANGFVLKNSNTVQLYRNSMYMFPKDYFCPKSRTGVITLTPNTYCIHHFTGSWQTPYQRYKRYFFREVLGTQVTDFIVKSKWWMLGVFGITKQKNLKS